MRDKDRIASKSRGCRHDRSTGIITDFCDDHASGKSRRGNALTRELAELREQRDRLVIMLQQAQRYIAEAIDMGVFDGYATSGYSVLRQIDNVLQRCEVEL